MRSLEVQRLHLEQQVLLCRQQHLALLVVSLPNLPWQVDLKHLLQVPHLSQLSHLSSSWIWATLTQIQPNQHPLFSRGQTLASLSTDRQVHSSPREVSPHLRSQRKPNLTRHLQVYSPRADLEIISHHPLAHSRQQTSSNHCKVVHARSLPSLLNSWANTLKCCTSSNRSRTRPIRQSHNPQLFLPCQGRRY